MDDRSVTQFLHFGAIDFSRPALRSILVIATLGLALAVYLYDPFDLGSSLERRLLPSQATALGLAHFRGLGLEPDNRLITALPVQDEALVLFLRDRLGSRPANERLRSDIPGAFWEIALRQRDDHTTAFELHASSAGRLEDLKELHHALIKLDEQGRWFQFYHRPGSDEHRERVSKDEALKLAVDWAKSHPLVIPGAPNAFDPVSAGEPQITTEADRHLFQWQLPAEIAGLNRTVALEVSGNNISYYGLEYQPPADYPNQHNGLRRLALSLRLLLLIIGILLTVYMLIKELRRDAIDFHFSFTYSAVITFPLIAMIVTDLPSLMNEGITTLVRENFYLLSSATFLLLVLLLLITPVVALIDSLVRQVWPEKLSTFDAIIRGRFHLNLIGKAILIGTGAGLLTVGAAQVANLVFSRFGHFSHSTLLSTSLADPFAVLWAIVKSLGLALLIGYLLLFVATIAKMRIRDTRLVVAISALVWLIVIFSTGGRYSSLINFGSFALINTVITLYLLFRYDLLTLIAGQFAALLCLACAQLLTSNNIVYNINGAAAFMMLGGLVYASQRLASRVDGTPEPEFVPQYIAKLQTRERIERDIEIARQLQFQFLPQNLPQIRRLEVATLCRPAYEVGGDYYDFIEMDKNRLGLVIADVSGKGIPAAFYMTMIKGIIQSRAFEEVAPRDLLKQINWVIYKNTGMNTFVTLFYAIIDVEQATIVYSNAGHNPPLIISRSGQSRELSCGGMVLGVMPQPDYQEETVKLSDGDLLVLYTDGVIETTDVLGTEFGLLRLAGAVKNRDSIPASHLITNICKALDSFAAGAPQNDDITMILVSYKHDEKINYRD